MRNTVLSLILLALLRIKRQENLKEYSPEHLGGLLGLDRMAEVKTLRRKLTLLAKQGKGRELMNELARLRLGQDEERLAFLYVDGHIREYSGKAELAKAKKAQRSVATPAATDTWLHDADGGPLLVVTSEMNAGLTAVLEAIVTQAKKLVPEGQRLTVLFDRGGGGGAAAVSTLAARELLQVHGGGVRAGCSGGIWRRGGVPGGDAAQSRAQACGQGTPASQGGSNATAGAAGGGGPGQRRAAA